MGATAIGISVAKVAHGKITCPDCTTGGTGGTSGGGSGGTTTTTTTNLTFSRVTQDNSGSTSLYVTITVAVSTTSCPSSISPIQVVLSNPNFGSQLVASMSSVDSNCYATYTINVGPGNTINGHPIVDSSLVGVYTITVQGSGYKTTSTNFTVDHWGAISYDVSQIPPGTTAKYVVQNQTGALSYYCDQSSCPTSAVTHIDFYDQGETYAISSWGVSPLQINNVNKILAFFSKVAHADGTATFGINTGTTSTVVFGANPPCTLNVTVTGNGSSSTAVTGASYTVSGTSTYGTGTASASFSIPSGASANVTNTGSATISGYATTSTPGSATCPAAGGSTISATIDYKTRAALQVQ